MNKACRKSWAACVYLLHVYLYLCIDIHKAHYTCYIFLYVSGVRKFCGLTEEG